MKWLALLFVVATGCTKDSLTPQELCDELASTQCTRFYQCHTAQEISDAGMPATLAACIVKAQDAASCGDAKATTYCATEAAYQDKEAFTCIDQGNAAACDAFVPIEDDVTLTSLMTITTDCAKVCK